MASSKFQQILLDVERERPQREAQQAALTQAHFERHPECKWKVLAVGGDGMVIRSKTTQINVAARIDGTWLNKSVDPEREIARVPDPVTPPQMIYQMGKKRLVITQFMEREYLPALHQSASQRWPQLNHISREGLSAAAAAAVY